MTKEELIKFLSDCYDQWAKDGFGDAGTEYTDEAKVVQSVMAYKKLMEYKNACRL